jgi:hypothetical protein
MLIPKNVAVTVGITKIGLTGLGASNNSITFHFQNGAWIKTHIFAEPFPDYQSKFETPNGSEVWAASPEFFKALDVIESFSSDGTVYFSANGIASDIAKDQASTYQVKGLPQNMAFKAKLLISVKHAFETAIFDASNQKVVFRNDKAMIRGVAMAVNTTPSNAQVKQPSYKTPATFSSDDIPF